MTNVIPRNKNKQKHGYAVYYWNSGKLKAKGHYINNKQVGYWVNSYFDEEGFVQIKLFYII